MSYASVIGECDGTSDLYGWIKASVHVLAGYNVPSLLGVSFQNRNFRHTCNDATHTAIFNRHLSMLVTTPKGK